MITVFAHGFVGEKPELQRVGKTHKVEFDVVSQRSVRNKESQQWDKVWERATFVAWDDEAERIASTLDKGNNVTCTGVQETSSWVDNAGKKQYRTKYKLTAWNKEFQPRADSASRGDSGNVRSQSHQRPTTSSHQHHAGADEDHGVGGGEGPHSRDQDDVPYQRAQQSRPVTPQPAYSDRGPGQQIDM